MSRCYCPDDCNCHYPWRPNYCGCKQHTASASASGSIAGQTAMDEIDRLRVIEEAARALYEQVEMDESVGVCLSDRVPSLRLGALLS